MSKRERRGKTIAARNVHPRFIPPLPRRLNVFYLTLDKVQNFASGKYDLSTTAATVEQRYAEMLTDAAERMEELSIRKPAQASARVLTQAGRSPSLSGGAGGAAGGKPGVGGLAAGAPSRTGGLGRSPSTATATSASSSTMSPPPYASGAGGGVTKKAPPPPPPTKPKPGAAAVAPKDYVVALYDYAATADGDLSFAAGDRIEVVERTASTEDWWTGIVNGHQGVFPGNYVRDA